MTNFSEDAIRETAYYIWKNNGCPANTSVQDWSAAIEQLERKDALAAAKKISSLYRAASLTPRLKFDVSKAAAHAAPYILAKASSKTVISAAGMRKVAKKSK